MLGACRDSPTVLRRIGVSWVDMSCDSLAVLRAHARKAQNRALASEIEAGACQNTAHREYALMRCLSFQHG